MTPARFSECLAALGWSVRALAERLGEHRTTVRRWQVSGQVPAPVAEWLDRVTEAMRSMPPPHRAASNPPASASGHAPPAQTAARPT